MPIKPSSIALLAILAGSAPMMGCARSGVAGLSGEAHCQSMTRPDGAVIRVCDQDNRVTVEEIRVRERETVRLAEEEDRTAVIRVGALGRPAEQQPAPAPRIDVETLRALALRHSGARPDALAQTRDRDPSSLSRLRPHLDAINLVCTAL